MKGTDWQIYDDAGRRKYLNEAERIRFLKAADREPADIKALCYLLCMTGCRISEALSLRRDQLDTDLHRVTFRTLKRRKTSYRSLPIPASLTAMLIETKSVDSALLWVMHRSTAWRHVKRIAENANICGPMATCKGCRHGFGIKAASASVPGNLIQKWLGHATQTTTAIYIDAVGLEERRFAKRIWE